MEARMLGADENAPMEEHFELGNVSSLCFIDAPGKSFVATSSGNSLSLWQFVAWGRGGDTDTEEAASTPNNFQFRHMSQIDGGGENNKPTKPSYGHGGFVTSLTPVAGNRIVSTYSTGIVRVFKIMDERIEFDHEFSGSQKLHSAAVTACDALKPEKRTIVTVAEDGSINVVDLGYMQTTPEEGRYGAPAACSNSCNLTAVKFIDPKTIVTAGTSPAAQLQLWEISAERRPKCIGRMWDESPGADYLCLSLECTLRPHLLAAGTSQGYVTLWDTKLKQCKKVAQAKAHDGPVCDVQFDSKDFIYSAGSDGNLKLIEMGMGSDADGSLYVDRASEYSSSACMGLTALALGGKDANERKNFVLLAASEGGIVALKELLST